jgi:hypothetical protein
LKKIIFAQTAELGLAPSSFIPTYQDYDGVLLVLATERQKIPPAASMVRLKRKNLRPKA